MVLLLDAIPNHMVTLGTSIKYAHAGADPGIRRGGLPHPFF